MPRARTSGWALEMLSHRNRNYASTCQTVGLNSGYFLSFTIFMALNSVEFTYVPHVAGPIGHRRLHGNASHPDDAGACPVEPAPPRRAPGAPR